MYYIVFRGLGLRDLVEKGFVIPEAIRNFGLSWEESPQSESMSSENHSRCCPGWEQMFQVGVSSPKEGNKQHIFHFGQKCSLSFRIATPKYSLFLLFKSSGSNIELELEFWHSYLLAV